MEGRPEVSPPILYLAPGPLGDLSPEDAPSQATCRAPEGPLLVPLLLAQVTRLSVLERIVCFSGHPSPPSPSIPTFLRQGDAKVGAWGQGMGGVSV